MKKFRSISFIVYIIVFALSLAYFCSGCDFVKYIEHERTQTILEDVKLLQKEYVDKLYLVTSEIKYREKEKRFYEYAMQDAINELYECYSETEMEQAYEKHLIIIGKIKTDSQYVAEEEANAISAYRTALLLQADKSYDRSKYVESQIEYLDNVLALFSGKLFETSNKEEMNNLLQDFYFDIYKEDQVSILIEYANLSEYNDEQKDILLSMLEKCTKDIRTCEDIVDNKIVKIQDGYKFEVHRQNIINKINDYADLKLYRETQAKEAELIKENCLNSAKQSTTSIDVDNVFREYQIAIYKIPTDEMLYSAELAELKEELKNQIVNTYKISFYRESEWIVVQELIDTFEDLLNTINKKENVLSQYILTKSKLDIVKTAKILDEEDRINLIEELNAKLKEVIEINIDESDIETFLEKSKLVYVQMKDRISVDGIRQEYNEFLQEIYTTHGATLDMFKEELSEYNSRIFYRSKEQDDVNALKEEYLAKFSNVLSIDRAKSILSAAKAAIDAIKTNDDLWNDSINEFRVKLNELYGDDVLEEPRSLTEADNYYELADIIDYYAFYQLSGTEFVCDTFRVKLNFDHNDAKSELITVYYYCELIRTAVGITNYFENNTDYLVFKLIPYNFASVSNATPTLNRLKNAVEYDSDKSQMTERGEDFDDFAYYKYNRTIKVWNSQQLWYALEHEYVPLCVPHSPAESVLNRAKEILREIILEGMTDEEKIFQIYTWFGRTNQYDWNCGGFFNSSNQLLYPDENVSKLRSFHAEGALFDNIGVCYSYAKSSLILLRLEGFETYYVFGRAVISDISYTGSAGAGHGYNYLHLNNNWYIVDTLRSYYQSKNYGEGISYLFLLLPAKDIYKNFTDRQSKVNSDMWQLIERDSFDDRDIYKHLTVGGNKIFITEETIGNILQFDNISCESFSIICDPTSEREVFDFLKTKYNVYRIKHVDTYIEFFCTSMNA